MPRRLVHSLGVMIGLCAPAWACGTVTFALESARNGRVLVAGTTIDWTIRVSVTPGDNLGLAAFSCDLHQNAANPALFDIPQGDVFSIPAALANFDRPAGFTPPGEICAPSGYVGVQRGVPGQMDLVQIGGAQNTTGTPLPPGTGMGENAVVVPGVGQSGAPQLVLSGTFPAPAVEGTYTFHLQNASASVLTSIAAPPAPSETASAEVNTSQATFSFTVAPPVCFGDVNCDEQIDFGDINAFVLYLSNSAAWQSLYPDCDVRNGDINADGVYPSFSDINAFVTLLSTNSLPRACPPAANVRREARATFSRASVAYLADNGGLTAFEPDQPRVVPVTVATVSDGAVRRKEALGIYDLAPQCQNRRYMFALRQGASGMYRTTDGGTWEPIAITAPPGWSHFWTYMFATAADTLLVVDATTDPDCVYRSTDDGQTWSLCLTLTPGSPAVTAAHFGLRQAPHGTLILAEYGGPGVGHPYKIYRSSDDGQSWTVTHTKSDITHFHAVGYHAATSQWFVGHGDGYYKGILHSTDDGLTWQAFHAQDAMFAQPVWFQDIGDPGRIWLGADDGSQVAHMDVLESSPGYKEVVPVVSSFDPRAGREYTFLMFTHAGVTYACNMDSTINTLGHYPVIVASLDGLNWATVHQFRAPVSGLGHAMNCVQFAGYLGGKLHLTCQFTGEGTFAPKQCHFAFTPFELTSTTGTLLEPGVHNFFDAAHSGCEEAGGPDPGVWPKTAGEYEMDLSQAYERAQSLRWYADVGGLGMLVARTLPPGLADGRSIYFRCRVKGRSRGFYGCWCDGWVPLDADKLAQFAVGSARAGNWIEHVGLPTSIGAPTALRYALHTASLSNADGGHNAEVWIDALQAAEVPITSWQMGSETTENDRAPEQLRFTSLGLLDDWTFACRLVLTNSPADLAHCTTPRYLFTIYKDVCNYASVYHDPADRALKLCSYAYGMPQTPLATAPLVGGARNLVLHVVLRHEAEHIRLSVAAGQGMEFVPAAARAALSSADTWLSGDSTGHNLMPFILVDYVALPGLVVPDEVLSLPDFYTQLAALAESR
ncbi:MAG: exo-alpha-sialidase [Phycisphaerae bacterium]|nr:exo-alpha-sialidase [Phycisphaerae bacterium]